MEFKTVGLRPKYNKNNNSIKKRIQNVSYCLFKCYPILSNLVHTIICQIFTKNDQSKVRGEKSNDSLYLEFRSLNAVSQKEEGLDPSTNGLKERLTKPTTYNIILNRVFFLP
jgi:hypothetical protein